MQLVATKTPRAGYIHPELAGLVVVSVSDGSRYYGLYRVKQIEARTIVLGHGALSFPVGTHLDIEDFKYQTPNPASFRQRTTVVENGRDGMRLIW